MSTTNKNGHRVTGVLPSASDAASVAPAPKLFASSGPGYQSSGALKRKVSKEALGTHTKVAK